MGDFHGNLVLIDSAQDTDTGTGLNYSVFNNGNVYVFSLLAPPSSV